MEEKVMRFARIIITFIALLEMILSIEIYSMIKSIKNITDNTYVELKCKYIEDGKCVVDRR